MPVFCQRNSVRDTPWCGSEKEDRERNGSPSDNQGDSPGREVEAQGEVSPLATDEEEEEEEEEKEEDHSRETYDAPSSTSLPPLQTTDLGQEMHLLSEPAATKEDIAKSSPQSVENPLPLSESHLPVSPFTLAPGARATSTATPPPPPPTSAPDPLSSLVSMTVPDQGEEGEAGAAGSSEGGRTEEGSRATPNTLSSSRRTSSTAPSPLPTSKNHRGSASPAAGMASILMPGSSLSSTVRPMVPCSEKDKSQRTSSLKGLGSWPPQHRTQSSFYEKMAAQALAAATSAAAAAAAAAAMVTTANDQPLDLSRKSNRPRSVSDPDLLPAGSRWAEGKRGRHEGGVGKGGESVSNGISSLQSLQKRFGGDFLLETPRRPSSIIPLQSTILPSKSILRPPPLHSNGLSHLTISAAAAAAAAATAGTSANHHHLLQQQQPHHHHHSSLTTSSKISAKSTTGSAKADRMDKMMSIATSSNASTTKKADKVSQEQEPSRKNSSDSSKAGKSGSAGGGGTVGSTSKTGGAVGEVVDGDNKYTIHRCSCQKSFGTLYALSAHLQETGHVPGSSKQQTLMDYPKLVRGQDMWLNQESEQTRRILRCMQCGESFKSLPMLTVHMMQTQHYSKIVSAEHGRRSHKCSAYCDRDLDRECIFKCKVCQETFTDMEGLANHMIVSGHHKKQIVRSHNCTELAMRHKHRKRFLSDDASGSTVATLLEYKRKYQGGSVGSNGCLPQIRTGSSSGTATPSSSDGLVTCESCGKKIEMPWFVEHMRLCLRQKAEVIDALKIKLFGEECASSIKPAAAKSLESKGRSPDSLEQPLPSTRDTALFKRLNSISCNSHVKDSTAESVHKDADSVEESKEKTDCKESIMSQTNGHDDPKPPNRGGVQVNDSAEHKTSISPKSPQQDADKSSASLTETTTSPSPKDGPAEETPAEAELCKAKDEAETELGAEKDGQKAVAGDRCIPPRIPSPMTDEENTSERSPSSPSDPSLSEDSKPPSPCLPSPPRPKQDPPPSQPLLQDVTQSIKREHDSDGEDVLKNHKKIKLEDTEDEHAEEVDEAKVLNNKIKVEIPEEDGSMKQTPMPSPVSENSRSSQPPERRPEPNEKRPCSSQDPILDIIDPNCGEEPAKDSGSSALKAMESFIQRSFSNKFDSRRNTMSAGFGSMSGNAHLPPMLNMSRVVPRSAASPSTPTSAASSMAYLSQFSRFLSPVQPSSSRYLDIGMESPLPSLEKNVLSSLSAKSAELLEKTRNPVIDITSMRSVTANGLCIKPPKAKQKPAATTTSRNTDDDDKEKESEEEREEQKEVTKEEDKSRKEEDLATKYLNLDEEEKEEKDEPEDGGSSPKAGSSSNSSKSSGKKSALDSLSSFVYGQPMTSEHPLDSLQKLLTKTSLPKVMAAATGPFPHFSPHHYPPYLTEQMMERMCFTPPDLPSSSAMPLNLSLKPGGGGSSSDEDDPPSSHHDCDSPSAVRGDLDDGNHSSPGTVGPDGELTEFKCAACSRRFASKGSYRYHLSRCHLSSVKKYGIKEAFNMSPYVYLPLDHTAKFTKYYQMAQELASKGK